MYFQPETIYHVYNQGNNRQKIFFSDKNYLFFLGKMRQFILPHADFLAYCLMPNHFHWLVVAKESACALCEFEAGSKAVPRQRLSHQINILLRSYTRAVNKQEGRSGSLFRLHTKARDGWVDEFIEAAQIKNGAHNFSFGADNDYATQCYYYIHENPVKAGLTLHANEWPYSSARDYAGLRKGTLCNQMLAKYLLGLP
jgi:putative transposase